MKSKRNIVFLGMMGSGKTSIGKLTSNKLKLDFFDTDEQIEKKIGMKISNIFLKKGEPFFREYEEKITRDILKKKNIIIALGGGTFLNRSLRKEILANHISIWLNWDNSILVDRIKNSFKRPIAMKSTKNELINLVKKRANIYSKALYKINCDNLSKNEITDEVIKIYEAN